MILLWAWNAQLPANLSREQAINFVVPRQRRALSSFQVLKDGVVPALSQEEAIIVAQLLY
jgi:hypothetical protein